MTLSAQKYQNTFRTISGLINVVFDNDVILLCDTALSAVDIDLAEIPLDSWNTVYKLYVVDKSNNAGANNITIKAPLGYTVNNASQFVINANGGCAIVRITSNTSYLAEANFSGGSGLAVQNEGVNITPSATTMNFVGAGVNATAVGGFVTVDIAGTAIVTVSNAQLLTLIGTNAVVPNTWYLVSDALFTFTALDTVPILVQGVTTNAVSLEGSGIFLNADYQKVGNYSGVSGFVGNLGVWQLGLIVGTGNVVIWNNIQYVNITGVNGLTPPDVDAVNWTRLTKSVTKGYIQEVDDITYRPSPNSILSRNDKRGNKIENNIITYLTTLEAFFVFQWGNNQVQSNTVNSESFFSCLNNTLVGNLPIALPVILGNQVIQNSGCTLDNKTGGFFRENVIAQESAITLTNTGTFSNNTITKNSGGIIDNTNDAQFLNNVLYESFSGVNITNDSNGAFIGNNVFRYARIILINNVSDISVNTFDNASVAIVANEGTIVSNTFFSSGFLVNTINTGDIYANSSTADGGLVVTDNSGIIRVNVINGGTVTLGIVAVTGIVAGNEVSGDSTLVAEVVSGLMNYNLITAKSVVQLTEVKGTFGEGVKGVGNNIVGGTVVINTIEAGVSFSSNVVSQQSVITFTTLTSPNGNVVKNIFAGQSQITITTNNIEISGLDFFSAVWNASVNNVVTFGGNNKGYYPSASYELDFADPAVYDLPTQTLTIPAGLTWVGIFSMKNASGLTVSLILGIQSSKKAVCFTPFLGSTIFTSVAVALSLPNEIVSSGGATTYTVQVHPDGATRDTIWITANDLATKNIIVQTNILT